jgi:NitT/TauT family transport system permease protein
VAWEIACKAFNVPLAILPAPSEVFGALWQYRKPILDNSWVTRWTTLAGFGIATAFGLALGIAIGWHRAIYAGVYPVLIGFNSVPKVAVVPVLILWFGLGEIPAILTAFLISFFPIVVNVATGLATTEPELEDVLRALGASKFDVMRKVGIPRSLPYFFGSLKVAITLAFVGAVVSETVGSNKGIGKLMLDAQAAFQVPIVFAGLIVLAVLGIALYAATAVIEARFTGWAFRGQANR